MVTVATETLRTGPDSCGRFVTLQDDDDEAGFSFSKVMTCEQAAWLRDALTAALAALGHEEED